VILRLFADDPAPVTLVCAPAGSGKTSLLASWAATSPDTVIAWLNLDDHDDDHAVADYLLSEVLAAVPGELRCFLLRTYVCAEMSDDLAERLTRRGDAAAVFDEFARTNTFTRRLRRTREIYRYHDRGAPSWLPSCCERRRLPGLTQPRGRAGRSQPRADRDHPRTPGLRRDAPLSRNPGPDRRCADVAGGRGVRRPSPR